MAKSSAKERLELPRTEVVSRGQVLRFQASNKFRSGDVELRAQFERLLIFVLCALWSLGLALWIFIVIANWGSHPGANSTAAVDVMSISPYSAAQVPMTLMRTLLGW